MSVTEARKDFGNIFGEVSYSKQRIILTNRKRSVAIVPIEDLEKLHALEDLEDINLFEPVNGYFSKYHFQYFTNIFLMAGG